MKTQVNAKNIIKEINLVTRNLISMSLCNDQNFPCKRKNNNSILITVPSENHHIIFKDIPYKDMYAELLKERNFNVLMIDGAIITMNYVFSLNEKVLESHRLAFFPSPNLDEYQNNPNKFEEDELYADILDRRVVHVPFRFDYDSNAAKEQSDHPIAHLTIGQYKNCRIPVSAALTPSLFIHFILKHFYNTRNNKFSNDIEISHLRFLREITKENEKNIYINLPI